MSSNTADEYASPGGGPADPRADVAQGDPATLPSSGVSGASGDGERAVRPDAAGQRSDAGVGGEVVAGTEKDTPPGDTTDASADSTGTQDEPAMDMHDTTAQAKIDGIVAQTRADFPPGSDRSDFEHALRQRFTDVGIAVDDERIRTLAAE